MQPIDVRRGLEVWERIDFIVIGVIAVTGRVAKAQEATDQEFFLGGEPKLLRILFLSGPKEKGISKKNNRRFQQSKA